MKKNYFKIVAFLVLTLFVCKVQGQSWTNGDLGVFQIRVQGSSPALYLTQSATTDNVTYETATGGDDQLFKINDHPDGDYWSITSRLPGKGALETLTSAPGSTTAPFLGCKGNPAGRIGQQDKWNPTRGSGTEIFLESDKTGTAWAAQGAKKRIDDSGSDTPGSQVRINGGSALAFDFVFVEALNVTDFDTSSIFSPSPVNDELTIEGLLNNVEQVSVFNLLGNRVKTARVDNKASLRLDVSTLSSGIYIVKMIGINSSYSKKIVKE